MLVSIVLSKACFAGFLLFLIYSGPHKRVGRVGLSAVPVARKLVGESVDCGPLPGKASKWGVVFGGPYPFLTKNILIWKLCGDKEKLYSFY